jgi:hypothetical protein
MSSDRGNSSRNGLGPFIKFLETQSRLRDFGLQSAELMQRVGAFNL